MGVWLSDAIRRVAEAERPVPPVETPALPASGAGPAELSALAARVTRAEQRTEALALPLRAAIDQIERRLHALEHGPNPAGQNAGGRVARP